MKDDSEELTSPLIPQVHFGHYVPESLSEQLSHDAGYAVFAALKEDVDVIPHEGLGVDGAFSLTHIETESLKEEGKSTVYA